MRIAWFAPSRPSLDDTASLLAELARTHEVAHYDARRAHDFVWQHARHPFDVCVYELSDTAAARFVWPYLIHYPGVVRLRSRRVRRSQPPPQGQPWRAGDDLRIPLLASRLGVVADAGFASALQERYPTARLRHAPLGVAAPARASEPPREAAAAADVPVFGVADGPGLDAVRRAVQRARDAGARVELRIGATAENAPDCDVILALGWPPDAEPPLAALAAMAATRPAIVHEIGATAAWPAIDPQTWQPRGLIEGPAPIVVSIDPLDEEHSLALAIRRLARDADLRRALGTAARTWWQTQASPACAAAAWIPLLAEAATLPAPARPPDWPVHLDADGTERAREILVEVGVSVDFLG